jgi:hypothetical protein
VFPVLLLVGLSFAFRWPALWNADGTNADAAIVGLQAMHALRGEVQLLLWGSTYQTSTDALVAAGFFWVMGPSPRALMLSALSLHVVATVFVYGTLRRGLPWARALCGALPMVFTTASVHSFALYPPRQASITLALGAMFAVGRASAPQRLVWLMLGGLLAGFACYADPYAVLFLPAICIYTALELRAARRPAQGAAVFATFFAVGAAPLWPLRAQAAVPLGTLRATTEVVGRNLELLWSECLPWALGAKVFRAGPSGYEQWQPPVALGVVQALGAAVLVGLVTGGGILAASRSTPSNLRRMGAVGALGWVATLGAFATSVMVFDRFAMRYLAALTPFSCLALGPLLQRVPRRYLGAMLALPLFAAGLGGWMSFGPMVRGPVPVRREAKEELALREALVARGIRMAMADYWVSYRLTFLWREDVLVVPRNASEDRYTPYRLAWLDAERFAYIFDPETSRETPKMVEDELASRYMTPATKEQIGRYTVYLVTRNAISP